MDACVQNLKPKTQNPKPKTQNLKPKTQNLKPKTYFMAEPLSLTVSLRGTREAKDNYQLFRMTGQLDAFSEPTFRKVMDKCVEEGPINLILDLSKIDFVDSSGIGALVQLVKKAQTVEGTVQIVTNARVTQTVKLVRLEKFLSLQPSVDEALAKIVEQA
jgi:anti-anti-sigma factor